MNNKKKPFGAETVVFWTLSGTYLIFTLFAGAFAAVIVKDKTGVSFYLSVAGAFPSAGKPAVPSINARDRIGSGPWYNAKGVLIARNLDHLHNGNHISKETALDERGNVVKGRGDNPNEHDMLTGSRVDGTAFAPLTDTTCKAWTSSNEGSAILGHHDRLAPMPDNWGKSWNSSHPSVGCSQEALIRTGGAGRFYCFAVD